MAAALLEVQGLVKRFGGFTALNGVTPVGQGRRALRPHRPQRLRQDDAHQLRLRRRCPSTAARSASTGREITALPPHQRTRLGIVRSFQIPKPFTSMTVLENLGIPLEYAGGTRGRATGGAEAGEILEDIGLDAKAHLRPAGLTQIEMRKLELARAMAARPKLLISDEAMAGLSSTEVDDILAILFRLNAQGITIIMIEHIMRAVMRFSERIVVLDAGERIAEGTPDEIVRNPAVEKAYLGE